MGYRLIEEHKLERLIEGNMIYDELCACGVDNWIGWDEAHFPDEDDIEKKIDKYHSIENLNIKDTDTLRIIIDQDVWDVDEAQQMVELFGKIFPKNRIFVTFKGIDITIEGSKENDK